MISPESSGPPVSAPSEMPAPMPRLVLAGMMTGYAVSQLIYVAAKLGLADLLRGGPQEVAELARRTRTDTHSLYRIMRGLVTVGVFAEKEDGAFELTPLGQYLRTDTPGAMGQMALCSDESYFAWGNVLHSVKTGEAAFNHVFGMDRYQYLEQHPEAAASFHAAMSGLSQQVAEAVLAAYDFSPFGTVVDVGGGHGTLLLAMLRAYPALRGVLFDTRFIVAGAEEQIAQSRVAERCEVVAGDFFKSVPEGGDAYLLSHVIHNWDDERSLQLLRRCRAAMRPGTSLLIVEIVMPARLRPSPAAYPMVMTDLQMLVMTGGRERTEAEFRALLSGAGFELTNIVQTGGLDSLIESVPV